MLDLGKEDGVGEVREVAAGGGHLAGEQVANDQVTGDQVVGVQVVAVRWQVSTWQVSRWQVIRWQLIRWQVIMWLVMGQQVMRLHLARWKVVDVVQVGDAPGSSGNRLYHGHFIHGQQKRKKSTKNDLLILLKF